MNVELDQYQLDQLTGATECHIHTHAREVLDNTSANELQSATRSRRITTPTALLTYVDHFVEVASSATITLPQAELGKEFHITLIAAGATLRVAPTAPNTIMGEPSMVVTEQWSSSHLKANETGNWYLV